MKRRTWIRAIMAASLICGASVFAQEAATTEATAAAVKGNPKSKIYHKPACAHYKAKGCTKEFKSEDEASKAGYKPCKKCATPQKKKTVKGKTDSSTTTGSDSAATEKSTE